MTNIPLDRIESIELSGVPYETTTIDFEEYFDDVIGVTIPKDQEPVNIQLKFSEDRYPYITSKPIHWSQKMIDGEHRIVEISVIPNKELFALLLSYGKDVEVLSPEYVREQIKEVISDALNNYLICADRLH